MPDSEQRDEGLSALPLGLAGLASLCCIGLATLAGGAVGLVVFQLFTGGLTGLLGGGSGSVNYHKADAPVGTSVGKTAPDATLQTVNGSTVTIQGSEKPTVIFLMASWCSSCRIESSALQEVEEIYGDRVRIISVDVDPKRDSMADLRAFKQKYGGPWMHAMATSKQPARGSSPTHRGR